jgi:hypothetical protein
MTLIGQKRSVTDRCAEPGKDVSRGALALSRAGGNLIQCLRVDRQHYICYLNGG